MNGFKNYQTWALSLWLQNTEADYKFFHELAQTNTVEYVADFIKYYIEEATPELEGFFSDILTASIQEVDWMEVAKTFFED